MDTKQVIVMRTDLNMRKGKMIAQGAHASIAFLTRSITKGYTEYSINITPVQEEWLENSFKKICVRVNSEEELEELAKQAEKAQIPYYIIKDSGLTEFNRVPTVTCMAIGPYFSKDIDKITGHLELL